jgi:hypothetical protein
MAINNSQRAQFPNEALVTMTGAFTLVTTLLYNPVIIIFDNQSTVPVALSIDGVNTWKTFSAGEALILDLRAASGIAPNFTIDVGTSFFGNGASGNFSISYIAAINT